LEKPPPLEQLAAVGGFLLFRFPFGIFHKAIQPSLGTVKSSPPLSSFSATKAPQSRQSGFF
jgi:hypothetical protein